MILISKYLIPKGYVGITFFPFIFLKQVCLKENMELVNHEEIHLRQQLELLILPFYVWYASEFLIRLCYYKNWTKAYENISFEREAHEKENDLNYLKYRSFWNFLKFI